MASYCIDRRTLLGATLGMAAIITGAREGRAASGEHPMASAKIRNVVLVHGAFTDGNVWSHVIAGLQSREFKVSAVQLPLSSLEEDVAATRRTLERQDGPAILVGHSWGGAVITEAGMASNVKALVYVSALAPDVGEAVIDVQKHGPQSPGMSGARPDNHGFVWFDPDAYRSALASDVDRARVGILAATQKPIAGASFAQPLKAAAWHDRPSWYLLSTSDQALSPELQRFMAQRMGARTTEVSSSHMSPLSHADAVMAMIEAAASV